MSDHHQHHQDSDSGIAVKSENHHHHHHNNNNSDHNNNNNNNNNKNNSSSINHHHNNVSNNIEVKASNGIIDNNTTHIREHHHEKDHNHHGDGEIRSAAIVVKSGPAINAPIINWEIGSFDCSIGKDCLSSFICPCFTSAYSRTLFDGSPFIFNLFCVGFIPTRYLIRTAYGINGSISDDILKSILCSCCSANQLYQTVKKKGRLEDFHTIKYNFFESHQSAGLCGDYCKAIVCFQCYAAKALEISVGMPYFLGLCCMNPCSARNIIRYHYRIDGHDIIEECLLPACLFTLASASLSCGFPCGLCCVVPPLLETVVKVKSETAYRERSELLGSKEKRYIAGFYTGQKILMEHNKRLKEKGQEPLRFDGSSSPKSHVKRSTSFKDSLKEALGDGYKTAKKLKSKSPHKTQPIPDNDNSTKPSDIAKEKHHHHHHHHHHSGKHKSHSNHDNDKHRNNDS